MISPQPSCNGQSFQWIFLFLADEIDALMKSRGEGKNTSSNNIVSTLLKEMGGERKQVYVIGNTNVPLTIGNYNNNIYYNE